MNINLTEEEASLIFFALLANCYTDIGTIKDSIKEHEDLIKNLVNKIKKI